MTLDQIIKPMKQGFKYNHAKMPKDSYVMIQDDEFVISINGQVVPYYMSLSDFSATWYPIVNISEPSLGKSVNFVKALRMMINGFACVLADDILKEVYVVVEDEVCIYELGGTCRPIKLTEKHINSLWRKYAVAL